MNDMAGGKRRWLSRTFIYLVLLIFLVLYLAPFVLILLNSFKTKKGIIQDPLQLIDPAGFTLENFTKAFEKMEFLRSFTNSLLVTCISVALIILFTSMAAYFFVRAPWKINRLIFYAMLAAMIVPFQVVMIPLVQIYGGMLGVLNHKTTLILMHVGFSVSLAVFIYHGFIKSNIPVSLEEAAMLDGCSKTQIFFHVVFPLLKPTTATIVVLNVLAIWNDYLLPSLVLTEKRNFTLPLSTYAFYGTYTVDYGAIMAALVLTTLPVILLYLALQRQIISGVVAGAVKA